MRQKDVATAFGVATKTIQRWSSDGMPRNDDKTYSLPKCFEWLIDQAKADSSETDKESERWLGLYRKERYFITKLDREERENELILKAEAEKMFTDRAYELARALLLLSRKVGHLIAQESETKLQAVVEILDREAIRLLENYSRPIQLSEPDK